MEVVTQGTIEHHKGIILTADCDIYNNKFGENITYLPTIALKEYIETIWAPQKYNQSIELLCEKILADVNPKLQAMDAAAASISFHNISDSSGRLQSNVIEKIATKIFDPDHPVLGDLSTLKKMQGSATSLRGYYRYLQSIHGRKVHVLLRKELIAAASHRRLEYFYLNYLPDEKEIGWIVLLRDIHVLPAKRLFRREIDGTHDVSVGDLWAFRRGRLTDDLRFALAQAFAALFSRIGLPPAFEEDRAVAFEVVADTVMGELTREENTQGADSG